MELKRERKKKKNSSRWEPFELKEYSKQGLLNQQIAGGDPKEKERERNWRKGVKKPEEEEEEK